MLKIVEDSFAHFILSWELLDATAFGPMDAESLAPPVEIVQAKARYLASPQTINRKQKKLRA
ncbi:MAG: hypothetical protein JF563_07220 [Acidobacteriales bacterium]|nr:hypothetical protein [Terriglobales bacterium]